MVSAVLYRVGQGYYYVQEREKIAEMVAGPEVVEAAVWGSSHARCIQLGRMGLRGKNLFSRGQDLFEVEYKVQSFDVAFQGQGGIWSSLSSSSDKFTSEQKNLFRQVRSGQRIMLEKIRATGPDGVLRNLNNITITVI